MSNWFLPSTPQDRSHKIPLKYLSEKMCFPNFALHQWVVAMMVCSNVDIISDEQCPAQTCKWCLTLLYEMKKRILIAQRRPLHFNQKTGNWIAFTGCSWSDSCSCIAAASYKEKAYHKSTVIFICIGNIVKHRSHVWWWGHRIIVLSGRSVEFHTSTTHCSRL